MVFTPNGDSQNDCSLDPDGDKFPVECGICEIMIGRLEGAFSSFLKISAIEKLVVDILLLFRFNWKLMNCCCYQEACLERTKIYFLLTLLTKQSKATLSLYTMYMNRWVRFRIFELSNLFNESVDCSAMNCQDFLNVLTLLLHLKYGFVLR